ncbi:LysE family translocator [Bailinhaonella thermotolerans]|uniref:LysE family translocator n=1 Tax=Bailinhaonella thermotolerans TaxID=1070861 RepID=A0A3A4B933_9ACTN|nr:LysE family translocator [Bailinhaonella thermotolerans]RJL35409.1 LysE family translocator [Bailinhaonella thermotolerans]
MIPLDNLLAFTAAATVLILIPGPSVLFVIGRALAHGRRVALLSVVGNEVGGVVTAAAVALGVGSLVTLSATAFTALKLAGAAYLVYLGVRAFTQRHGKVDLEAVAAGPSDGVRALRDGFLVGVTNPKSLLFFAAVLPQFVDRAAGHVQAQMLLLGLVFTLIALLLDGMWGLAASAARTWFGRSPRRMAALGGAGGLAMIGLGVTVAFTGRKD